MAGGKQAQIRNHVLPVPILTDIYTGRWVEGLVRCFAHYPKRHLNYVRKTSLQVVQSVATSISELKRAVTFRQTRLEFGVAERKSLHLQI
ncbi:hypothetical protein M404DRAFT_700488 [Pisolithus tinctorius Marx 270]|uniref:Uncharacterized protein n=1 Tax=Pisolithus tinctorius Marx 270 TaxID=870435 RepID=A0A0C3PUH4_PISTI|nr:hypothetical protein M404DRAFT_700488 [Pisolithus tinctorius Marx 270]